MSIESWAASVAAVLTTISFLPQAVRTVQTKDVQGMSLLMYSLFTLGVAVWLVYGILVREMAIILANAVTFVFAAIILIYIVKYRSV